MNNLIKLSTLCAILLSFPSVSQAVEPACKLNTIMLKVELKFDNGKERTSILYLDASNKDTQAKISKWEKNKNLVQLTKTICPKG